MREVRWILRAWSLKIRMWTRWKYEFLRRKAMIQGYKACAQMANAIHGPDAAQRYAYSVATYETNRLHKLREKHLGQMRRILEDCPVNGGE